MTFNSDDEDRSSVQSILSPLPDLVTNLSGDVIVLKSQLASTGAQLVSILSTHANEPPASEATIPSFVPAAALEKYYF